MGPWKMAFKELLERIHTNVNVTGVWSLPKPGSTWKVVASFWTWQNDQMPGAYQMPEDYYERLEGELCVVKDITDKGQYMNIVMLDGSTYTANTNEFLRSVEPA